MPLAQYFDSANTVDSQPLVPDDMDSRPPKSSRWEEVALAEREGETLTKRKMSSFERRRERRWKQQMNCDV